MTTYSWLFESLKNAEYSHRAIGESFAWRCNAAADIRHLEEIYGDALDDSLYAFLKISDGAELEYSVRGMSAELPPLFLSYRLLSVDEIIAEKQFMADAFVDTYPVEDFELFRPMIPIADLGDAMILLTEKVTAKQEYRFMIMDHDVGPKAWQSRASIHKSFDQLLRDFLRFSGNLAEFPDAYTFLESPLWRPS